MSESTEAWKRRVLTRYNPKKRGSFQISLTFYDWELSQTIGAIRLAIKQAEARGSKGHLGFLKRLEAKFSSALGQVLKAEFRDLKLKEGQKEIAPEEFACKKCGAVTRITDVHYKEQHLYYSLQKIGLCEACAREG